MAIVVIIKRFNGLSGCGKGDRFVKIDFRGVSHYSSALQDTEELVEVNESFTWNFGTAVQEVESLQLAVVARNVLRSEKVIARYGLVLQSVVRDGRVSITDALVDLDNKPIAAVVTFEIRYDAPDGSCSSYATTEMLQDERQMLIDIEENIANLERTLANREEKNRSGNLSSAESTDVKSWSKIKNLVKQQQRRNSANASSRSKSSKRALKSSDATTPDRK